MDYAKQLLKKEKAELKKYETFAHVFEMLCNQQEIKNVGKKAMALLQGLKGEVLLAQYAHEKFHLVSFLGAKEKAEHYFEDRNVLKKVKDSGKPLFDDSSDKHAPCHIALPILSKDEFLGALLIYDKQEVKVWEEIYTFLHLSALVFKHYELVDETKNSSIKDYIATNLFNYRHFQDQLELELEKYIRYRTPLTLLMVNIQNFKMVNDTLGFEAGDEVLRQVAGIIEKSCRRVDMPARLNGDEFGILLSQTNEKGAYILLNRLMIKFSNHKFKAAGKEFKIKIKASLTPFDNHVITGQEFIVNAKNGLRGYSLKEIQEHIDKN